jgi:hypothetical protein
MKRVIQIFTILVLVSTGFAVVKKPHDVPLLWKIPYTMAEVGGNNISPKALQGLNDIRRKTKKRYRITSGFRNKSHNKRVGGVSNSQHTNGLAFDVWVPHSHREEFYAASKTSGFSAFGWGNNSVHIDMGKKRWWTYNDQGKNLSGSDRLKHLHKAPANFKKDFRL